MTLFYDRLIRYPMSESDRALLRSATVLLAEFDMDTVFNDFKIDEIPALTPPYASLFVEFKLVDKLPCATHVISYDQPFFPEQAHEDAHWYLAINCYVDNRGMFTVEPVATVFITLDSEGQAIVGGNGQYARVQVNREYFRRTNDVDDPEFPAQAHELARACIEFTFYAIGLTHCKNVVMAEPTMSRAQQKKRDKHGKTRYYVLKITGKGHNAGERMDAKRHNALHWARGHFRTYDDSAPLFGFYTGTVWVTPHIRGRISEGVITKDYRVKGSK